MLCEKNGTCSDRIHDFCPFLGAGDLPALTLFVLGRLSSTDKLTARLPKWLDRTFWFLVLTSLGPAFVLPCAITVAYEMGIKPFVGCNDGLMIFSIIFCALTLTLAVKPGILVDYIGKVMTPAPILMLAVLVIAALVNPLGGTLPHSKPKKIESLIKHCYAMIRCRFDEFFNQSHLKLSLIKNESDS